MIFRQPAPEEAAPGLVDGQLTPEAKAAIAEDLHARQIAAHTREQLVKLEAGRRARDQDRALRMAALESGELSASAEAFLTRLAESAAGDLEDVPDPVPLIDGLLYRETTNYLVGSSGSYKTAVALDIAARVAGNGARDFCGLPVTPARALYVIAEGASGMKSRKHAWEEIHNDGRPMQHVTFIPFAVQIHDLEVEMPALIKYAKDGGFGFIVFDTQAMCTIGVDENSNDEMAMVTDATVRLARATGGCVLTVHHAGKSDAAGMRGASGMYANANTVIAAKREKSEREVTLSTARENGGKQKDADEIQEMHFDVIKASNNSIALGAGDRVTHGPAIPDLLGRYDVTLLNVLLDHQNLGATKAEIVQYVAGMGVTTAAGQPLNRKTVHEVVDRLVGAQAITPGPRFRVSALGQEALRKAARDEATN